MSMSGPSRKHTKYDTDAGSARYELEMGWADAGDVCDSPPALIGGTFLNVHM